MPATIEHINSDLVKTPLDPTTNSGNIRMSASYLKYLINSNNGDYRAALASYYQGQASVAKNGLYDDTEQYVSNVMALKSRYF